MHPAELAADARTLPALFRQSLDLQRARLGALFLMLAPLLVLLLSALAHGGSVPERFNGLCEYARAARHAR